MLGINFLKKITLCLLLTNNGMHGNMSSAELEVLATGAVACLSVPTFIASLISYLNTSADHENLQDCIGKIEEIDTIIQKLDNTSILSADLIDKINNFISARPYHIPYFIYLINLSSGDGLLKKVEIQDLFELKYASRKYFENQREVLESYEKSKFSSLRKFVISAIIGIGSFVICKDLARCTP